jgi:hypothetical protein
MFTKKERSIYRFWNGEKNVGADPLVIQRRLASAPDCDWEADVKILQLQTGESLSAFDRLAKAARHAFKVRDFEEIDGVQHGLLDSEIIELMVDFVAWMNELKKKGELPQVKPKPGESESSLGEVEPPPTETM